MDLGTHKSARQWALRALGRRMQTAHEIRVGLSRRGYAEETIAGVVKDLCRLGYINDLEFTRTWVTSRSAHQMHGRFRLLKDLRQKGIPDEMAESVISELLTDDEEVRLAVRAAEKKRQTMRRTSGGRTSGAENSRGITGRGAGTGDREILYRYLRSRGFTTRAITLALAGFTFEEDET